MDALVSTQWLAEHLEDADLRVLDARWFIEERDAAAEFQRAHIPGARFLDLTSLADATHQAPMMLPPAGQVADRLSTLGVGASDRIVVYDNSPLRTSARAWWMLHKIYGLPNVAILDGRFGKWQAEGRPVESDASTSPRSVVSLQAKTDGVRELAQMTANLNRRVEQVVDARGAGRFSGAEAEPRPDVTPGHIPGSMNLPYHHLVNEDGTYKTVAALQAAFDAAGVDLDSPLVVTCGSGITAAVLVFAAHLLGKNIALYDGSWSEWGADPQTPKATGAA